MKENLIAFSMEHVKFSSIDTLYEDQIEMCRNLLFGVFVENCQLQIGKGKAPQIKGRVQKDRELFQNAVGV